MELINALEWRYATKKMNGQAVDADKVDQILRAAHLAPSSAGFQPYHVLLITNQELKKEILPIANNQQQIVDCSHLLVFAAWDNYTPARFDSVFGNMISTRNLPTNALDDFRKQMEGMLLSRSAETNFEHCARQAYISFGMALAAAAELQVDATPMEGFKAPLLDVLLGLDQKGLKSVCLLPLGYRDASNDWLVNLKKVRTPMDQFVIEYK